MPEKLTVAVYLERRGGTVKTLTRIEAEAFGVPYPLVKGWPYKYAGVEITQTMLDRLQEKIGRAKSSTAEKARRGLAGVEGIDPAPEPTSGSVPMCVALGRPRKTSPVTGFVLRQARRYRARKPAPW